MKVKEYEECEADKGASLMHSFTRESKYRAGAITSKVLSTLII